AILKIQRYPSIIKRRRKSLECTGGKAFRIGSRVVTTIVLTLASERPEIYCMDAILYYFFGSI
ncbi:MAG: hypothetical protein O9323_21365, partial [Microcystis sp. LE19-131.1A]|uniref:hypothetical protein n=1 Tax=Microcystis sp. LE19-131.1A TaxID=3016439 RepID=UPI0022CBA612